VTPPAEEKREFIHRLEALRGVAAMMVALGHCAATFQPGQGQQWFHDALITVFNGRAAVTIFFVLSGFVLGLSLRRSRQAFVRGYFEFVWRRFFRIYPALAVSSLAILGFLCCVPWDFGARSVATTPWFQAIYSTAPGWRELWRNLLLQDFSINQVTWSLKVELVGSALLPLMHVLSQKMAWRGRAVFMACWLALAWIVRARGGSLFFTFMFYLGYLLPDVGPTLMGWLNRRRAASATVLVATTLCLLARWQYNWPFESGLVEGFSATVLIAGILYGPELRVYRLLDTCLARFYGRISYSFYLLHFCVMYGTAAALAWLAPEELLRPYAMAWSFVLAVVSVAIATPLSWASYQWVERPGIELGRLKSKRAMSRHLVNLSGGNPSATRDSSV